MSVIVEQAYFVNLKVLRNLLKATIREHEKQGGSQIIIDDIKDAVHHITKAIDILEWDDE
tara:strand:+ start:265 stop:444 length:180 start_codon:yes stop_codon:yes gene_type:complete